MSSKTNTSRSTLILLLLATAFILSSTAMTPLWAHYSQTISGDLRTAGTAVMCLFLSFGLSALVFSFVENRFPRHKIWLLASYLLFVVSSALFFLVSTPLQLFALQVLFGIAAGMEAPAFDSLYGKTLSEESQTFGWGLQTVSISLGTALSAFISSRLAWSFGYSAVFAFMLGASVIAFIVALVMVKGSATESSEPSTET